MKKEEYDKSAANLKEEHEQKKETLMIAYAMANNNVNVDDIISDHKCKIKVKKISVTIAFMKKYPECVYNGIKLKKDNTPFKNGENESVFQSDIT